MSVRPNGPDDHRRRRRCGDGLGEEGRRVFAGGGRPFEERSGCQASSRGLGLHVNPHEVLRGEGAAEEGFGEFGETDAEFERRL